ncbi:SDR family NAD(P)-dependent oxidoreductase [Mycobacterium avium]|uniref:Dehydrogenase DhgA n=3 Tax=Mycobacterium avium TaxID=1764 RepID=Q8GE99_MYCAV|nr:SDR family NAD(P)-dependent oxidoreductase [Mycobacterium avium]AAN05759.1 dehydrogenase DhgA [Mycobacterium avium subsp. hominissuis A5]AXO22938.1 KR domain-containing protein [Mycobacterium avium subsp. hominissuis]KDO95079.1 oxidoreductase [Mycobacterium avium subsp. hominissuis A5]PBA40859.1 oxidoreductase [Mycobacterium avium]PBA71106.1 oxidoreductase [Mycobacterium avium]
MALAMITGASSGIGLELAELFAQRGYDLVVAAENDGIYPASDSLSRWGVDVRPVQVDLRTPEGVEKLYREATEGGRGLDAVALNAGVGGGGSFVEGELAHDLSIIDLNVRSTVHLAKLVLRNMTRRNTGKVLFTSSLASMAPGPFEAVYHASKSFVQSFAGALRDELRDTGITVTALMPGTIETNFFSRAGMDQTRAGQKPKDDPAEVARQGFEAMMRGHRKVVGGSLTTKTVGVALRFLPDSWKAAASRANSTPAGRR